jgi:hypothetical protein
MKISNIIDPEATNDQKSMATRENRMNIFNILNPDSTVPSGHYDNTEVDGVTKSKADEESKPIAAEEDDTETEVGISKMQ